MRYPLGFSLAQARYLAKMGRKSKRFPTVCMLEPLYTCNLSCRGCTTERHTGKLADRLTVEQCLKAVEDCGVPIVAVCGGEPLLYPELPELLEKLIARGKYIIMCTNALLADTKLFGVIPPSNHLFVNVHLDGMKKTHDFVCDREGVWDRAMAMLTECKERGYLTIANCTVYKETDVDELQELCETLTKIHIDGLLVSPGYSYESVKEDVFLTQTETQAKFKRIMEFAKKYKITATPAFLEFCAGLRELNCAPYSTVNYTPNGWKAPCYLIGTEFYPDYQTFWNSVDWEHWEAHTDERCANCKMHSGFEQPAVAAALRSIKDTLRLAYWEITG